MKYRSLIPSALLATLVPSALLAQAAVKDEVVQLPAFTISSDKDTGFVGKTALSSTRIAVDLSEIPQSVKVLNSSFLKAVNPFMLTDILNYTGGAQNGQLNWTPGRLNIRGFTASDALRDGFRNYGYLAFRDVQNIDHIEVLKGPAGALYGSASSLGGYINTYSKRPQKEAFTELGISAGSFGFVKKLTLLGLR